MSTVHLLHVKWHFNNIKHLWNTHSCPDNNNNLATVALFRVWIINYISPLYMAVIVCPYPDIYGTPIPQSTINAERLPCDFIRLCVLAQSTHTGKYWQVNVMIILWSMLNVYSMHWVTHSISHKIGTGLLSIISCDHVKGLVQHCSISIVLALSCNEQLML